MKTLLGALRGWPDVDTDRLSRSPEWEVALTWGWVMRSGELTGMGYRHVHEIPRGILNDLR
jgi:hypothetical protein